MSKKFRKGQKDHYDTLEQQLHLIKEDHKLIKLIKNPFLEVQLKVIKRDPPLVKYIKNPPFEIQKLVIDYSHYLAIHIDHLDERLQLRIVNSYLDNLHLIKYPTKKVQEVAFKKSNSVIRHIKFPSKQMELEAVKNNPYFIKYIKNPPRELIIDAIKRKISCIFNIKNPDKEMILYAVTVNPKFIKIFLEGNYFIDTEIKMQAIKSSGYDKEVIQACFLTDKEFSMNKEDIEINLIIKDIIG